MARKVSQNSPALSISFFNTGFFTNRNLLFAPYKGVGINVLEFHDPLAAGNNMEVTDQLQIARRPGFSIFCNQPLPDGEVVNDFYSTRNLNGTVQPFVDTTRRLAIFSPTTITTVLNKSTPNQGYITTIGNMTYISDGASLDITKYDGTNTTAWGLAAPTITPVSTGLGFWQPNSHFSIGNTIQDTNGNIEAVSAILVPNGSVSSPTAFSNLALAGGTGTWAGTVGPGGTISETLGAPGHTNYLFFESANLSVPSGATIIGVTVSMSKQVSGGTAQDQSVKLVIGGAVSGVEHASASAWNTASLTSVTYGSLSDNWGGLTPAQANVNGAGGFGVAIAANVLSTTFYSLVQSGVSTSLLSASTIYSFPRPVQAGNTLVIGVQVFDENFVSIHDSQGNAYTLAATESASTMNLQVYVAHVTTTGSNTITVTTSGNGSHDNFTTINAHEFRGILAVLPIETTGKNNSLPFSVATPFNSGTAVISNADDLLFSYVYTNGGGATQPAPWTMATNTTFPAAAGTQQVASAFYAPGVAASYSPSWSRGTVGITVALKSSESATVTIEAGSPAPPIITIYYKLPSGSGPGFSGNTEPIWPTNLGTSVNDGGIAWTNYGPAVVWYPLTNYPTPIVILDTNGYLQLATAAVAPVQAWNSGTAYAVGNTVSFGGTFWIATASSTNIAPNSNYSVATTVGSAVTTVSSWAPASNPIITGSIAPVWNTTVGGTTPDGSYTWTNIGQGSPLAVTGYAYVYGFRTIYGHLTTSSPFSNNTGAILGPLNGSISSFSITTNVVTFQGSNNFQLGNIFTVSGLVTGTYLNEQVFSVISATNSLIFPLTSVAVSGANVLTIQAINNLSVGQTVTFSSVGVATFLNGVTVTVLAGGLSGTQFTANFTHGAYGPTADTGSVLLNGSWTASFTHADTGGSVSDAGIALPLISMLTGTGTGSPLCTSVATITGLSVLADIVTIIASNNFQPGLWVTISGLTSAPYLNGQQVEVISVDQPVGTQNTQFQVFFQTPNSSFVSDAGTATFNAVEIYRVSDGGGQYLFAGAVTNPGMSNQWTFDDFVPDANLDILLTAPLAHQNDPPPGAAGSTITTQVGTITKYWNGRLWMIVGNFVYFSAGPDCVNGIPEEAWPPGNRFQFAGPPIGLEVTPNGAGLLVLLADRVNAILGGPETISFYPDDFLTNFGITSPNALFKDGSLLGLFTTQGRYVELMGKEQQDTGEHIADYLSQNFDPSDTYVTTHRNGLDVGMFLSNGVDRIVRYGTNIGAWSVPAFPVFGAGALASIETSVGTYSLMAASPTGGITGTVVLANPASGTSVIGTGPAWVNPGNIVLGNSTSYAVVTFSGSSTSQTLRAGAYTLPTLPLTAVVQGIQVSITGKQSEISGDLSITIKPTNGGVGATAHTFFFGTSNSTQVFGGTLDTWGVPGWITPTNLVSGALSFDITAALAGASVSPTVSVSEVQVTVTYQNPGNYLYARDVNSWGDCGGYGLNNGTPYAECNVVIGSITLSQLGGRLFPLEHVVGYFDAVGNLGTQGNGGPSYPNVWVLPNEVNANTGVGFVQLPDVLQEPPVGQNNPSATILALRWPVNMVNSALMSQYIHHLQLKVEFEPENAPSTIKAIAFMEQENI